MTTFGCKHTMGRSEQRAAARKADESVKLTPHDQKILSTLSAPAAMRYIERKAAKLAKRAKS